MSTISRSSGLTFTAPKRRKQPVVRPAGEEAVDEPVVVRDVALDLLGEAHVLEALVVCSPLLLARQVGEVLRRDRRHARVVAVPRLGHVEARRRSPPPANRVSDQISMSVSSGPSGRNRYDEALLYIGSTKKCGKQ